MQNAIQQLLQRADDVAEGKASWPASAEDIDSIWDSLSEAGVITRTATESGTVQYSGLTEFVQILLACVGASSVWEIPWALEEFGIASARECNEVWEAPDDEQGLHLMGILVNRAYGKYFGAGSRYH